ncbi:hypothetical protein NT239_09700 [Chitinibacter sp. SCUT-21]|uniref:zinc-dependent metalloprotease family protein n=1 Tax=Chitinibacter sp. SCUT-21 TaxID=2970891 RepID=UPI0035A6387D
MSKQLSGVAIAISLVLSACGGGGGGSAAPEPTAVPSYTPPPADAVSADPSWPSPVAIPFVAGSLLISEISSSNWIEIYNPNDVPVDLSRVKLRTFDNANAITEFSLPAATILAKGYVVLAARPSSYLQSSNQIAFVGTTSQYPVWNSSGFVELITADKSIDFVRYGSDATASKFPAQSPLPWSGSVASALNTASYGNSIVRPASSIAQAETNTATDWQAANFVTPYGANDVPNGTADSDNDGIPDSAEVAGGRFAGLDLYAMGARTGQRDIFLEIDYMSSTDEGVKPRAEALQKIVNAFAAKGFALHIDAGVNVAGFNLGNSKSVLAFNNCLDLGDPKVGCADVYQLKTTAFDLRRSPIFHYAVMGYKQGNYAGSAGLGEIAGNDFNVTLGGLNLSAKDTANKNFLINTQAGTIMHELGHNLGLEHGGFETLNGKPNYVSVMNYMYSQAGIPPSTTGANAGQRWYIYNDLKGLSLCSAAVESNTCSDSLILDYSNGSSVDLNEASLLESELLGRGSTASGAFIDWNRDGANNLGRISSNIDDSTALSTLKDYNDWANLILPFSRQYSGRFLRLNGKGNSGSVDFLNDQQTVAHEVPMVKAFP